MKNQYFGDINDFLKYGLIRSILRAGKFRMLVAWMLTEDDNNKDGNFRDYLLKPKWRGCDSELYDGIQILLKGDDRKVSLLEQANLLPGATYYSRKLTDDTLDRSSWEQELMARAHDSDIVFLDPDNGIQVPSKPYGRKNSSKYLYWREVIGLWKQGKSILIYQHFRREERDRFIHRILGELRDHAMGAFVEAFSTPRVVFFLVLQPEHQKYYHSIVADVADNWGGHVSVLPDRAPP